MSKEAIFVRLSSLVFIFLLYVSPSVCNDGTLTLPPSKSEPALFKDSTEVRARQYFISNRDSYVNAANSFGGQGHSQPGNSYQVPQSSYNAPMGGYGGGGGGYGYGNSDTSSKGGGGGSDLIGLVGLLGLKGLKGTIPVIKLIALTLIALSPILIPLAILKLLILLFKPVITFGLAGRSLNGEDETSQNALQWLTQLERNVTENNDLFKMGVELGSEILGREFDNQCMERIACEGLLKSMPRIFLRILGENFRYTKIRRRRNTNGEIKQELVTNNPRKKDLATLALNKLKNPQFLTKKQSLTENSPDTEKTCRQYKCTILF